MMSYMSLSENQYQKIKKAERTGGNASERRGLRRYLNRHVPGMTEERMSVIEIASALGLKPQTIYKFMHREKYLRSGWMYRRPEKPTTNFFGASYNGQKRRVA